MELEIIVLISQTQKDKYHIFSHIESRKKYMKVEGGLLRKRNWLRKRVRRMRNMQKYGICMYENVTMKPIFVQLVYANKKGKKRIHY
jgi:HJR/Mrr/RecB family endonuclease